MSIMLKALTMLHTRAGEDSLRWRDDTSMAACFRHSR